MLDLPCVRWILVIEKEVRLSWDCMSKLTRVGNVSFHPHFGSVARAPYTSTYDYSTSVFVYFSKCLLTTLGQGLSGLAITEVHEPPFRTRPTHSNACFS